MADNAIMAHMYASPADREQLQKELRTQLQLNDRPRPSSATSNPGYYTGMRTQVVANAAQLEELMLMEALRRSLMDVQKEGEIDETRHSDTIDTTGVLVEDLSPSPSLSSRASNPFDSHVIPNEMERPRAHVPDSTTWNPFA